MGAQQARRPAGPQQPQRGLGPPAHAEPPEGLLSGRGRPFGNSLPDPPFFPPSTPRRAGNLAMSRRSSRLPWPRREEPSGSMGGGSPPLSSLPAGEQVARTAPRASHVATRAAGGAGRWPSSAPRPRQHLFPRICSETWQLFHNPERRVGIDEDKSKDACPQPRPPRPRRATAGYSTVTGTFTRAGGPTASSKPDFPQEHTADLPTFPPKKQMPRTARGLPGR